MLRFLIAYLCLLCSCSHDIKDELTDTSALDHSSYLDISKYTIVVANDASPELQEAVAYLRRAIDIYTSCVINIKTVNDGIKENRAFVGNISMNDNAELLSDLSDNDYIIKHDGNDLFIFGEDDISTLWGIKEFIESYVVTAPCDNRLNIVGSVVKAGTNNNDKTILPSLTTIYDEFVSVVEQRREKWPTYGRIIELKHNGKNNGVMFVTSQWSGRSFPIYRSDDGGNTWELISEVKEQIDTSLIGNWQPHLYELPCKVGNMPEGTLLLTGCSHDNGTKHTTKMCIWKSDDLGLTWNEISVVDSGGGISNGMYEPFLICDDDGRLVCFYSDETEVSDKGGQRLVFRVSDDGVHWGQKQYCVAPQSESLRPGMVSVAKMGEHGYLMVYEIIGLNGGPVYYKTSESLTSWDPDDLGVRLTDSYDSFCGCTPYCEWTPADGEFGTVIASGRFGSVGTDRVSSSVFYSFDLGNSWHSAPPPLEYDFLKESIPDYAYSFGFGIGNDGSVYYINNVFPDDMSMKYKMSVLKVAKIKIQSFTSYRG